MGKKGGSTAAKAAKKVKAAQKVERKETKKALKSKDVSSSVGTTKTKGKGKSKKANDSDTDDDDLEGILERVSVSVRLLDRGFLLRLLFSVDAKRMGTSTFCH